MVDLREGHCHVTRARVVWIYSEIKPHTRYCDPREVTFDHPGEDVLFVPVADEHPHCWDFGRRAATPRQRRVGDAERQEVD